MNTCVAWDQQLGSDQRSDRSSGAGLCRRGHRSRKARTREGAGQCNRSCSRKCPSSTAALFRSST